MGGTFQKVEQTGGDQLDAKCFVKWNTKTKMWEKFHGDISGYNNRVNSIQIDTLAGFIYIGGNLSQITNDDQTTIDPNNVAMWDGSKWTTLANGVYGRSLTEVETMALTTGGDLYVGGRFSDVVNYANSISSHNIAKWNGEWSGLGSALSGGSHVYALASSKSGVWVSGDFKEAGDLPSYQLAKWSGPGTQPVYYTTDLSEINTVQPQFGASYGTVDATLLGNRLSFSGNFKFYKGKFDTAFVSMGGAGVNGDTLFGLNPELSNQMMEGNFKSSENTFILNQNQMIVLQQNKIYISVVNDSTPAGIMRGQVLLKPNTAPADPKNLMPKTDTLITIEGSPTQKVNFTWDSSTDPENNKVVYVFNISTNPEFTSNSKFIDGVNTNTDTKFSVTYAQIDTLLNKLHLAPGSIDTLYDRIIATDGSDYSIGQTNRLILKRGILGATARVQLVNNSADPGADSLKVMLNGFNFYPYLNYRKASPFIKIPADTNLIFKYVDRKGNTFFTDTASFSEDENSIMVLSGLKTTANSASNPDNKSIELMNVTKYKARLLPSESGKIDVCTIDGITDLGKATVALDNSSIFLAQDIEFGDTTGYKTLGIQDYNGTLTSSEDPSVGLAFNLNVSDLIRYDDNQDSVFALLLSGFDKPRENIYSPDKKLVVVYPHGLTKELDLVTGVEKNKPIPISYSLSQNYPNPFNPSTTIKYSMPAAGNVNLSIYNMLGQKVMTLVNGQKSAGYHSVQFNSNGIASGVYLYVLKVGDKFSSFKKMILLK